MIFSVDEKRRTFLMARPKCLMGDFTNLYGIYKAHQTNVWWTMKVFRLHWIFRTQHIPLPDGLGQVKLPLGQVDLNKVFLYILYKEHMNMHNFGIWASKKFEICQALILHMALQWLRQNINKGLTSQKTPHTSPSWTSYGISFSSSLKKKSTFL